jgi:hypothetical protein
MSTDTRRGRSRARRGRAFLTTLGLVALSLALVGAGAAAIGVIQGPRITSVQVDPDAAVTASGSRLIVTTTQSLSPVDASQVTVEPAVPFAVDTSGRSVGVRFALPLRDETQYTVSIEGLQGLGGGPETSVVETFETPALELHLLQRAAADGDTIFRTDLEGESATPVFTHTHIEDFRATASHLVVSVREDDRPALIVTDLEGNGARELPLPGDEGIITGLQAADRGETIGYTFTDADLGEDGGLESALFTASASQPDVAPTPIEVEGADPRIADWRFVPDTNSILLLGFDGSLLLTGADGGEATLLGTALAIDGIAGTSAIVERLEALTVIDLTDGSESPLIEPAGELGIPSDVVPVPGGGTLRTIVQLDESGVRALGITVAFVADDGADAVVAEVDSADALVQTCVAPSGRYAALLVAPDAVDNAYDRYTVPLPERLETRVVDIATGEQVTALAGFDISWCRVPPG